MAFTLRDITEGLFKNGYAWTGHPSKDKALVWAKTGTVQPGGKVVVASAALAIPITHSAVTKSTGGAETLTLANGTAGQVLSISCTAASGTGTLTPTTATGFVDISFIAAGDTATLMYVDDTVGWVVLGTAGVTAPPALVLT
jgi:hypothetical protein